MECSAQAIPLRCLERQMFNYNNERGRSQILPAHRIALMALSALRSDAITRLTLKDLAHSDLTAPPTARTSDTALLIPPGPSGDIFAETKILRLVELAVLCFYART
jgi:hypothetical protein